MQNRRYADPDGADELGRLDADAIDSVRQEAWPRARSADEMHEALHALGVVSDGEAAATEGWLALAAAPRRRRAGNPADDCRCRRFDAGLWVAAEWLPQLRALHPRGHRSVDRRAGVGVGRRPGRPRRRAARPAARSSRRPRSDPGRRARRDLAGAGRGHRRRAVGAAARGLRAAGPLHAGGPGRRARRVVRAPSAGTHPSLHAEAPAPRDRAGRAARLHALPVRMAARRRRDAGQRSGGAGRRAGAARGLRGAGGAVGSRDPAGARARLLDRVARRPVHRRPHPVDAAASARGRRAQRRHGLAARDADPAAAASPRRRSGAAARRRRRTTPGSARARAASSTTSRRTARRSSTRSPTARGCCAAELEDALADLVARGRVHCDSYAGLRALLLPASKRSASSARRRRGAALFGIEDAGRWALVRHAEPADAAAASSPADRGRLARRPTKRMPSSTSPAPCCGATASSPGACSSASRAGCRRGATWFASTAGSRRAASFAAAASSPACPASSSRCRRRSA